MRKHNIDRDYKRESREFELTLDNGEKKMAYADCWVNEKGYWIEATHDDPEEGECEKTVEIENLYVLFDEAGVYEPYEPTETERQRAVSYLEDELND